MADHATGAEYPDWIIRSNSEDDVALAIAQALSEVRNQWDCLWMPNVAGWTGAYQRISAACRQQHLRLHVRRSTFALVRLPESASAYISSLSKHKQQLLRTETRKVLGRRGVGITSCRTWPDLPRFVDALFDLHYRRHSGRGDDGAFRRKPAEAQFYREFIPVAFQLGWLRFFGLEECGILKAVQIGYVYRNIFHAMQEGFDPSFVNGAGHVLRAKAIENCIAEGVDAYDFLGEMTDHKRRWLASERLGYDLFMAAPHMKARLLFLRQVWPTGRFLRPIGPKTKTAEHDVVYGHHDREGG
jgi:CelD/BcsL family acetyltransferase involved in cellulose biosynthesis